jgi:plastocyanin
VAVDLDGIAIQNAGSVSWSSSAPSVASINGTGVVTAVTPGVTSIAATIRNVTGNRLVTVLPAGAGAVVTMPGFSFVPFEVTISVGQSVFFEFPQTTHNAIFQRKAGAPQDILETRNETVPRVFNLAGQFPYDCTLHPGMSGVVNVNP